MPKGRLVAPINCLHQLLNVSIYVLHPSFLNCAHFILLICTAVVDHHHGVDNFDNHPPPEAIYGGEWPPASLLWEE